jgi:hypothetical protein
LEVGDFASGMNGKNAKEAWLKKECTLVCGGSVGSRYRRIC